MSRSIQKTFRGLRALVIMAPDSGCQTLERTLRKLGLEVTVAPTMPATGGTPVPFDVIFFDADGASCPNPRGKPYPQTGAQFGDLHRAATGNE